MRKLLRLSILAFCLVAVAARAQEVTTTTPLNQQPYNPAVPIVRVTPGVAQTGNLLELYSKTQLATPAVVTFTNGGAGTLSNYYAQAVWVDYGGRQSLPGPEASLLNAGNAAIINPPVAPAGAAGWLPYVSVTPGHETLQAVPANCTTVTVGNVTACAPTASWTTPASGIAPPTGVTPPTMNSAFVWATGFDADGNLMENSITKGLVSGACVPPTLGGVLDATCFNGADMSLKIAAAIADLPATNCSPYSNFNCLSGIVDARGFTGAQTWSVNPLPVAVPGSGYKKVKLLLGDVQITHSVTISLPGDFTIEGAGRTQTIFKYTGNGDAFLLSGVKYNTLSGLQIDLSGAGNSAVALHLLEVPGTYSPVSFNSFQDIEIDGANTPPPAASGQTGIMIDAQGAGGQQWIAWNNFSDFWFNTVHQTTSPFTSLSWLGSALTDVGVNNEGNKFTNFQINNSSTPSGYAITVNGQRNSYLGFWIGYDRAFSTVGNGFHFTASTAGNLAFAIGDLGGALFTDAGNYSSLPGEPNLIYGRVIAPTVLGNSSGTWSNPLGMARDTDYEVSAESITGADHAVFMASVSGFSNGFTVNYTNAPQSMSYSFLNGPVGIGLSSPVIANGLLQLQQNAGSNVDLMLNQDTVSLWKLRNTATTGDFALYNGATGTNSLTVAKATGNIILNGNLGIGKTPSANAQLDVAKSIVSGLNPVTFSATPTFLASLGNTQTITLTGNVTSSTLSNATAGQRLTFNIYQDATGSRTFVWPLTVVGAPTISSTPLSVTSWSCTWDGTNCVPHGRTSDGSVPVTGGITLTTLATPVNAAFSDIATGGTLLANTAYYYRVSANNSYGETLASVETSLTTANDGNNTHQVVVNWAQVNGATFYKVYGRSTAAELQMATVYGGATLTWTDNGSVTPSGALPAVDNSSSVTIPGDLTLTNSNGLQGRNINFFSAGSRQGQFLWNPNGGIALSFMAGAQVFSSFRIETSSKWHFDAPTGGAGFIFSMDNGNGSLNNTPLIIGDNSLATEGQFTTYNGIPTVSGGVAAEYAYTDLTAQGAAIGPTTLYAVPSTGGGMYRISWNAKVTTAGTTSVLGGAGGFQITYTDADDSVTLTPLAVPNALANGNTTATQLSGVVVVNAKASTNISYQFGYTSTGTQMLYSLHVKLEKL